MTEPDILEGKLEALPRAEEELGWFEVWLFCALGVCAFACLLLLLHFVRLHAH